MRPDSRFAGPTLVLALLTALGCEPDATETPAPQAAAAEGEATQRPAQPCRSMSILREALHLGAARVERSETELTGEAPAELVLFYAEDDEAAGTDDTPTGAKRARLIVVDCSGDAPRSIGAHAFSYVDDPDTAHLATDAPGLRVRPVAAGDRTFLRVDVTSLAARVFAEQVAFFEVHDDALREVFTCETALDVRTDEGTTTTRREVRMMDGEGGLRVHVRRQRGEGAIEEADYAWSDGTFAAPDENDLCN